MDKNTEKNAFKQNLGRGPNGVVRHYMIVLKKGIIPPKYIKQDKQVFDLISWIKQLFCK